MVFDAAVEDVFQGVFPHKLKAQDPYWLAKLLVCPEVSDFFDCVYLGPAFVYKLVKLGLAQLQFVKKLSHPGFVASDVEDGGLSIVFGDIFGLVLVRAF